MCHMARMQVLKGGYTTLVRITCALYLIMHSLSAARIQVEKGPSYCSPFRLLSEKEKKEK